MYKFKKFVEPSPIKPQIIPQPSIIEKPLQNMETKKPEPTLTEKINTIFAEDSNLTKVGQNNKVFVSESMRLALINKNHEVVELIIDKFPTLCISQPFDNYPLIIKLHENGYNDLIDKILSYPGYDDLVYCPDNEPVLTYVCRNELFDLAEKFYIKPFKIEMCDNSFNAETSIFILCKNQKNNIVVDTINRLGVTDLNFINYLLYIDKNEQSILSLAIINNSADILAAIFNKLNQIIEKTGITHHQKIIEFLENGLKTACFLSKEPIIRKLLTDYPFDFVFVLGIRDKYCTYDIKKILDEKIILNKH